ncbi:swr1-complex protein 5 [Ophiocordyceps camponoti-floridani]|uniref:Swr1-complex protein 5 n=1 Tax=Ophiocordyceps camponoti-floridani TaxID=2030778 RepID=A0A8H4Q4P9_9HYPO|nr:swr1-complex protein 5 [Ophiocordyceps camponoti-floridani]
MPMKMRLGMRAASIAREEKRRRQARENGIVLEANRHNHSARRGAVREKGPRRDRDAVGSLRGAELRLSKRDVESIQRSRDVFGRK